MSETQRPPSAAYEKQDSTIEEELAAIRECRALPTPDAMLQDNKYVDAFLVHLDALPQKELVRLGQGMRKAGHGEALMEIFDSIQMEKSFDEAQIRTKLLHAQSLTGMSIGALGAGLIHNANISKMIGMLLLAAAVYKAVPSIKAFEMMNRAGKIEKFRKALTLGPAHE
jgi:hypothetical protein